MGDVGIMGVGCRGCWVLGVGFWVSWVWVLGDVGVMGVG